MRFLFFFLLASYVGLTGCNSSDTQSPRDSFAIEYCTLFQPCCVGDAGATADPSTCRAWVASQSFNESAAAGCLAAMRDAGPGAAFCQTLGSASTVCGQVFEPTPTGTVPPGGACSSSRDCAGTNDQVLQCTHQSESDGGVAAPGTCLQISRGAAGDAPCFSELVNVLTVSSWPLATPYPLRSYFCAGEDGLYCDFPSHTCRPYGQPGQPCDFNNSVSCGPSGTCSGPISATDEGTCLAPLDAGASCQPGLTACGTNAYCSSTTNMCTPYVASGGACTAAEQCVGSCTNGACVSPAQAQLCPR